jgi:hypothetical protein
MLLLNATQNIVVLAVVDGVCLLSNFRADAEGASDTICVDDGFRRKWVEGGDEPKNRGSDDGI